jgi:tetratricopeptide (TPR) repeat protein
MSFGNTPRWGRSATLTIFFLLLISPAALFAQSREMPLTGSKEALALFLQGRAKIDNLEDPGTLFDQAVGKDPDFAMAYLFAGRTNQDFSRNLEKAVSLADKVSPGEREWILAAKAQAEGDAGGRKEHLDRLVALHPKDPRAHEQVGNYYNSIGDNATALRHFTAAVKLDKGYAPAYNNIGYMNMPLGRYAEAERAFKTYIKLIPKNPNPYDSYAELLMKTGKYDESIAQYNRALAVDPTFFNSYRGMGNNYEYKGDYAKARESYRRMYDGAPDDAGRDLALVSEMNSYVAEGKTGEALAANERRRAMAEKAGDVQSLIGVHTAAGLILVEAGKLDDAAKQFEKADQLREDPSLPAAGKENRRFGSLQSRARLAIARQEFGPAKAQLEEMRQSLSSRKNPNQERAYNQTAGFLELGQKDYAKALEHFAKANPNDPYVWYYQAVAQEGAGDRKGAAALYRKVADWNQLDATGYAVVRSRAVARGVELAKQPK